MSTDKVGNDGPVKRVLLDLTYTEAELHTLGWVLAYAYGNWAGLSEGDRAFIDQVQARIQDTLQRHFPKKKLPILTQSEK